jgi:WD40 repeat protein
MIRLVCTGCGKTLRVQANLAGHRVACPTCRQISLAPAAALPETATLPPRAPVEEAATLPPIPAASETDTLPPIPTVTGADLLPAPVSVPGYEILAELGRGGMGVVYKAQHTALRRTVALKMILGGGHATTADLERFRTEAESIARLQHPHIVQIYEVGQYDGLPYFSLEFCPGGSLEEQLAGTPLPAKKAAALVEQLARAMQAAHDKGVIHRDLKPANVLLGEDGTPKITDFGLAKKLDEAGHTRTGSIMGTPSYMAPEQADGKSRQLGPACDIYALGALLYECLTGRPPFRAATPLDTVLQVVSQEPVPPKRLNARVPTDLETICLKCLNKEPAKRYGTAQALAEDLERFLAGEPIRARPAGRLRRTLKWVRRRPLVASLLAVVFLVTALGIAAFAWAFREALLARDDARDQAAIAKEKELRARKAEGETRIEWKRAETERVRAESTLHAVYIEKALQAWRQHDVAEAERILNGVKPPLDQTWEQRHVRDLCRRKAMSLVGHTGEVASVAISADGGRIVSAGGQLGKLSELIVWDGKTGQRLHILKGHTKPIRIVAISADGKRIVSGSDDSSIKVWNAETGQEECTLKGPPRHIFPSVAMSADGQRIVSTTDGTTLKIWNADTGQEVSTLKGHPGALGMTVAISADGKRIVSRGWIIDPKTRAQHAEVKLWDAETGQEKFTFVALIGLAGGVAMSPDGKRIASGTMTFDEKNMPVGEVKVWDAESGQEIRSHQRQALPVYCLALSADGKRIFTGSFDRMVKIWEPDTGKELFALGGHTNIVQSVAFSADGKRIVSAGRDGIVKVWDLEASQEKRTFEGHKDPVASATLSPDGKRIASASWDKTVKVWDAQTGQELLLFEGHTKPVISVAFSPDGKRIASGSADRTVKVWNAQTGKEQFSLKGQSVVSSLAFSADGKRLVSGDIYGTVKVWNADTGQEERSLKATGSVCSLAISADGKRIVAAMGSIESGGAVRLVREGQKVAHALWIWDARTGADEVTIQQSENCTSVALSPDGKYFVTAVAGNDATVKVWDTKTRAELFTLKGHAQAVARVAISPDGKRIVTGSYDGTVKLWDAETGQEKLTLKGHQAVITSLAFSADGTRLISASWDKTVKLWEAPAAP